VLHINYSTFIAATLDTKRFLNKENLWVLFKELDIDNSNIITIENMRDVM
jgi:Ca2+-binding EF-hand superfamily protein